MERIEEILENERMKSIIEKIDNIIVGEKLLLEDGEITKENVENDIRLQINEIIELIEEEIIDD